MGSYTIERFGSIHPRVQTNCGLGNTIPGQELEWVSVNGLLVSSRPIKFNISWDRLNKEGLVYGKKIAIDGKSYTCRLVKNYPGPKGNWEWHDIGWSWCIDASTLDNRLRYLCSGNNAHSPMTCSAKTRSKPFGWRPVLEPVSAGPNDIKEMFGSVVTVAHNSSVVVGMLTGISDYDLVLRRAQFDRKGPDSDDFAKRIKDGTIVVNRDLVDYISQTQDSES